MPPYSPPPELYIRNYMYLFARIHIYVSMDLDIDIWSLLENKILHPNAYDYRRVNVAIVRGREEIILIRELNLKRMEVNLSNFKHKGVMTGGI